MLETLASHWASLAESLGVLAATLLAGYLAKHLLFRMLRRWSAVMTSGPAAFAVRIVRERFMFWTLILGLELARPFVPLSERWAAYASPVLLALWVLSLVGPGARLGSRVFANKPCAFGHTWNWPRRRDGVDTQVCMVCGMERHSPVQFARAKPSSTAPAA